MDLLIAFFLLPVSQFLSSSFFLCDLMIFYSGMLYFLYLLCIGIYFVTTMRLKIKI